MLPQNKNQPIQATTNKKDSIKIIKGVVFLLLSVLFLFMTSYHIKAATSVLGTQVLMASKTYLNFAASVFFALIGILEMREGVKNGK